MENGKIHIPVKGTGSIYTQFNIGFFYTKVSQVFQKIIL